MCELNILITLLFNPLHNNLLNTSHTNTFYTSTNQAKSFTIINPIKTDNL